MNRRSVGRRDIVNGGKKKKSKTPPPLPFLRLLLIDSRLILVIFLQLIANQLFPDHQSVDAFKPVNRDVTNNQVGDGPVEFLLSGFKRWDAIHFLHIAEFGYTFENNLAFFPLYPTLVYLVTRFWHPLVPLFSFHSALLITAVTLNLWGFVAAGYFLYKLTLKLFKDSNTAYLTLILFAINPASVFFSTSYSETLFAFLTWTGLFCLYRDVEKPVQGVVESGICFGLALLTRSNGILNAGFVAFVLLSLVLRQLTTTSDPSSQKLWTTFGLLFLGLLGAVLMFCPYLYHQYGVWRQFCVPSSHKLPLPFRVMANENGYILPGDLERLSWCNKTLPLSYSAVQSRYWDVGFMGYYQLRKIPCFLLALPAFLISAMGFVRFFAELRPSKVSWVGLLSSPASLLPFLIHVAVMGVVALFFINVEVYTRLLFSASPLPYWFLAVTVKEDLKVAEVDLEFMSLKSGLFPLLSFLWRGTGWKGKTILVYLLSYSVLGTCLHVNHLPWT